MARRGRKPKLSTTDRRKPKQIAVELIDPEKRDDLYSLLSRTIDEHHSELAECDIALAWKRGWRANSDGVVRACQAVKTADLDREIRNAGKCAVILLNAELWQSPRFSAAAAAYWLDFALRCVRVSLDRDGSPKRDAANRLILRLAKPPIAVFPDVYERHGCVIRELAEFKQIMDAHDDRDRPLLQLFDDQSAESKSA